MIWTQQILESGVNPELYLSNRNIDERICVKSQPLGNIPGEGIRLGVCIQIFAAMHQKFKSGNLSSPVHQSSEVRLCSPKLFL